MVMVTQKKQRRVSDSVLPALGLRKNSGVTARGGHVTSSSTHTSPHPWAVINFDIFWVLLGPNTRCADRLSKACGPKSNTNGAANSSWNSCHACHCTRTNGHDCTKCRSTQGQDSPSQCKQTDNNNDEDDDECLKNHKEGQSSPSSTTSFNKIQNIHEYLKKCPPSRKNSRRSDGCDEREDEEGDTWARPHLSTNDSVGIVSRDKTGGGEKCDEDGSVWCGSQGVGGGRRCSQVEEGGGGVSKPSGGGVGREGGGPPRPSPFASSSTSCSSCCSCRCCSCCGCGCCSTMHQVRSIKKVG